MTPTELDELRAAALAKTILCDQNDLANRLGLSVITRTIREADRAAGLVTVEGFDTTEAPHEAVIGCIPLVLYFRTEEDAQAFADTVREALPGMVATEVQKNDRQD